MICDLVIEGGGSRSLAFLGALQELEERGHTIGRILGTSAGGITAAMLACGYGSQEATQMMYDKKTQKPTFANLFDKPAQVEQSALRSGVVRKLLREMNSPHIPDFIEEQIDTILLDILLHSPLLYPLLSFLEQGHWFSDEHFLDWLANILDSGSFNGNPRRFSAMTLEEFYHATGAELSLLVSDITDSHVLILNHRTAPDCPLIWALRMSAGLPLLWQNVAWQDAWGMYLAKDITGHQIVEGEIFSPFPIELFMSDLPQVAALVGEKQSLSVLGFVIDETIPVPDAPVALPNNLGSAVEQLPPANSLTQVFKAILQSRKKLTIDAVEQHIIHLPAKGYQMLEFQLTSERFNALIEAGKTSTQRYFDQRDSLMAETATQTGTDQLISSPSVIQYINDSAKQQLSYVGVVNNYYNVDTGGGAYVEGNVTTNGGDFVGRDNEFPDLQP